MLTREDRIFQNIGHVIMLIASAIALIPVILMFISSMTDNAVLLRDGYTFLPSKLSAYAYEWVFSTNGGTIIKAYGMSFLITIAGTSVSLIMTTLMAYGLSKKGLPLKGVLTFIVFFTMLFNGGLVPTYINYTGVFHIKDTVWGLLIPSLLMNAYNVLLMKCYFVTSIPDEILDAAFVDGAGEFRTMFTIAIPMAKPIIATIGMFVGIAYWNDWNNGFIYLVKRTDLFTIQNLLNRLMQSIQALATNSSNLSEAGQGLAAIPAATVRMAMATLGILPIVVVYPFIQKNFVKGITLGGVKG